VRHLITTNNPEQWTTEHPRLDIPDSSTDPDTNGEIRRKGADVKVYSGGEVRNLSDVVYADTPTTFEEEVTINDVNGLTVQDGSENDRLRIIDGPDGGQIIGQDDQGNFFLNIEANLGSYIDVVDLHVGDNSTGDATLDVNGAIKISSPKKSDKAGMIRWTGSDFEGYDGSSWISLT
jgi:hypothetical protein